MYLYVKNIIDVFFYFLRFLLSTLCCNADKYIFRFNSEDIYILSSWCCSKNNAIFQNFSLAWTLSFHILFPFYFFITFNRVLIRFLTTACLFRVLYQQIPVNMGKNITALKHCDDVGTVVIAFNRITPFFWVNENQLSICYKLIICYNL